MAPEIGQVSGRLEEEEYGFKPRSKVYAGPQWGWQTNESYQKIQQQEKDKTYVGSQAVDVFKTAVGAVADLPGVRPVLKAVNGAMRFITEPLIQAAEDPSKIGAPEALAGSLLAFGSKAEKGGAILAKQAGVDPIIGSAVAGGAYETVVTGGAGKLAAGLKNLPPPPTTPALALATNNGKVNLQRTAQSFTDDLAQQASKPLQIASNLEETGWQGSIRTLLDDKAPPTQIKRLLNKPYHKDLPKKYQYLSMDDFAANKGGWLDTMIEKAEAFKQGMREFRQKKSTNTQRRMYDDYTENPLNPDKQLYDPTNPIRKAVTTAFNTVVGKEWHHIFGNKEAAEFMLSRVAQDPYIAVNLIHHLHKIGLPTSGVPQNIALMKKAAHRKTGGYHSWSKALGFENVGRKKGVLEISDYSQEISKGILEGTTEVTELFDILTTYSKVVQQVIKPKIKELGGEVISEMGPVMKYIQGVQKSS